MIILSEGSLARRKEGSRYRKKIQLLQKGDLWLWSGEAEVEQNVNIMKYVIITATIYQADPYTWKPIEPSQPSINYIQVNVIIMLSSSPVTTITVFCFCHCPQTNHRLVLIQTSDVEEKPWKRKKYVTTTSKSSRQKLRKEDWMKKAAAKEDKVLR